MPKAYPYYLMDYTYAEQRHRILGSALILG